MSNCTPQNIKYVRNPHYWQSTAGKPVPQIQEVDYPAFLSNTSANLFLAQGQAPGQLNYIWLDRYIGALAQRHVRVLPVLFDPPANLTRRPAIGAKRGSYPPRRYADLG